MQANIGLTDTSTQALPIGDCHGCDVVAPENAFLQLCGSDPSGFSSLSSSPPSCCHPVSLSVTETPKVTLEPGPKRVTDTCRYVNKVGQQVVHCLSIDLICSWFPHVHMRVFVSVFLFCVCVCVFGVKNNKKHSFIILHRGHLNPAPPEHSVSLQVGLLVPR